MKSQWVISLEVRYETANFVGAEHYRHHPPIITCTFPNYFLTFFKNWISNLLLNYHV